MLGARRQVGAVMPASGRPPGTVVRYPANVHEIHRVLAVTAAAGAPSVGVELGLHVSAADRAAAADLVGEPSQPAIPKRAPTGQDARGTEPGAAGASVR